MNECQCQKKHCVDCEKRLFESVETESQAILRGAGFRPVNDYPGPKGIWNVCCENHHVIEIVPYKVLKKKPVCRWCQKPHTQGERELFVWLESLDETFYCQYIFKEWCLKNYRYDFVLPERKIILEVDGLQHFQLVKHWRTSVEEIRSADVHKMILAIQHGYKIIRLFQPDLLNPIIPWKSWLHYYLLQQKNWDVLIMSSEKDRYTNHVKELGAMYKTEFHSY